MRTLAVVMLVGPGEREEARVTQVLSSLADHERDSVADVVLIDDCNARSVDWRPKSTILDPHITVLKNPRHVLVAPADLCRERDRAAYARGGGQTCGILAALRWLHVNSSSPTIVKLDTDALVVAPFSAELLQIFANAPKTGLIGTVGRRLNPLDGCDQDELSSSPLLRLSHLARASKSELLRKKLEVIQPIIDRAIYRGYLSSHFCAGGAYALRRQVLNQMWESNMLSDDVLRAWATIPIVEDITIGMMIYSCGYQVADYSIPQGPFAVSWRGLAGTPISLYARGAAIIHSVKNDSTLGEAEIVSACKSFSASGDSTTAHDGRHHYYYVTQAAGAMLKNEPEYLVVAGTFTKRMDFGSMAQVAGVLDFYSRQTSLVRLLFVDAANYLDRAVRSNEPWLENVVLLLHSLRPLPRSLLEVEHLEEFMPNKNVRLIHCCGLAGESGPEVEIFLDSVETLLTYAQPRSYVLSSIMVRAEMASRLLEHMARTKPNAVGLQDTHMVHSLSNSGIAAVWSADDAISLFHAELMKAAPPERVDAKNAAIECSFPPWLFYSNGTVDTTRSEMAIMHTARDIRNLISHIRCDSPPLLFNASRSHRGSYNTWSSLEKMGLLDEFPIVTTIDLIAMLSHRQLDGAGKYLNASWVSHAFVSDRHVGMMLTILGIPAFISQHRGWDSDYSRRFLGQYTFDLEHFMKQDPSKWQRWTVDQISAWSVARSNWESVIVRVLEEG